MKDATKFIWPEEIYDYFGKTRGLSREHVEVKMQKRARRANEAHARLKMHLPSKFRGLLDVGSGLAMAIPLIVHDTDFSEFIHLLDGQGNREEQRAGYKPDTRAWSDVKVGARLVENNLEKDARVYAWDANNAEHLAELLEFKVDLITSFRSWGHHYPIPVYIKMANRMLTTDGIIITDIRNDTDGLEQMKHYGFFVLCNVRDPSFKCKRYVFVRN